MSKKSDAIYNSILDISKSSLQSPQPNISKHHCYPSVSSLDPEAVANCSDFKVRDSSTGGKLPKHGPRRPVFPSRVLSDDFVLERNKFTINNSQQINYKAICNLASSRYSG